MVTQEPKCRIKPIIVFSYTYIQIYSICDYIYIWSKCMYSMLALICTWLHHHSAVCLYEVFQQVLLYFFLFVVLILRTHQIWTCLCFYEEKLDCVFWDIACTPVSKISSVVNCENDYQSVIILLSYFLPWHCYMLLYFSASNTELRIKFMYRKQSTVCCSLTGFWLKQKLLCRTGDVVCGSASCQGHFDIANPTIGSRPPQYLPKDVGHLMMNPERCSPYRDYSISDTLRIWVSLGVVYLCGSFLLNRAAVTRQNYFTSGINYFF